MATWPLATGCGVRTTSVSTILLIRTVPGGSTTGFATSPTIRTCRERVNGFRFSVFTNNRAVSMFQAFHGKHRVIRTVV